MPTRGFKACRNNKVQNRLCVDPLPSAKIIAIARPFKRLRRSEMRRRWHTKRSLVWAKKRPGS